MEVKEKEGGEVEDWEGLGKETHTYPFIAVCVSGEGVPGHSKGRQKCVTGVVFMTYGVLIKRKEEGEVKGEEK